MILWKRDIWEFNFKKVRRHLFLNNLLFLFVSNPNEMTTLLKVGCFDFWASGIMEIKAQFWPSIRPYFVTWPWANYFPFPSIVSLSGKWSHSWPPTLEDRCQDQVRIMYVAHDRHWKPRHSSLYFPLMYVWFVSVHICLLLHHKLSPNLATSGAVAGQTGSSGSLIGYI